MPTSASVRDGSQPIPLPVSSTQVVDADNKLLDVNANVSEVEAHVEPNAQQRKTVNLVVAAQGESNSHRYQYQLVDASHPFFKDRLPF